MSHQHIRILILASSAYRKSVRNVLSLDKLSKAILLPHLLSLLQSVVIFYHAAISLNSTTEGGSFFIEEAIAGDSPFREVTTEQELRVQLERKLREVDLAELDLSNPFLNNYGVVTSEDFIHCLGMHISEIFIESLRLDDYAKQFLSNSDEDLIGGMRVSIYHIIRHHIPFLIYPLEWACDTDNWA
jgi:hypothetical protein